VNPEPALPPDPTLDLVRRLPLKVSLALALAPKHALPPALLHDPKHDLPLAASLDFPLALALAVSLDIAFATALDPTLDSSFDNSLGLKPDAETYSQTQS
jgi:hypothetical protein